MRAWLQEELITIEGTLEEWRTLLERMVMAHRQYPSDWIREIHERLKQFPYDGKTPAVSNTLPDLEWHDKHDR